MAMRKNKKEEIMEKAIQLFMRRGYKRTTMRELAKAVNIQAPGIYHYFRSKKDILYQINETNWQKFCEQVLAEARKEDNPEERIKSYIRNMLKMELGFGEKFLILEEFISTKYVRNRKAQEREVFCFFRDALHELAEIKGIQNTLDPTVGAFSLFAMITRIYKWYNPKGKLSIQELTDQITRLFFHGVYGR